LTNGNTHNFPVLVQWLTCCLLKPSTKTNLLCRFLHIATGTSTRASKNNALAEPNEKLLPQWKWWIATLHPWTAWRIFHNYQNPIPRRHWSSPVTTGGLWRL